METFTTVKSLVHNPHYHEQRHKALSGLDIDTIDKPIAGIVSRLAKLSYCFTLQSCYGHFLYGGQKNTDNIDPLPLSTDITNVEYRIAYVALCIQNNDLGHSSVGAYAPTGQAMFTDLSNLPAIDPEYVQFGCAEWFWKRQVNSYTVQVAPERYKTKDRCVVDYQEALHIEKIRNDFFGKLERALEKRV